MFNPLAILSKVPQIHGLMLASILHPFNLLILNFIDSRLSNPCSTLFIWLWEAETRW